MINIVSLVCWQKFPWLKAILGPVRMVADEWWLVKTRKQFEAEGPVDAGKVAVFEGVPVESKL